MDRDEVPEKEQPNAEDEVEQKKTTPSVYKRKPMRSPKSKKSGMKEKKAILSRKRKFIYEQTDSECDCCDDDDDGKVNDDDKNDNVDALSEDCMAPSRGRSARRKIRSQSKTSSCGPRGRSKSRAGMKRKSSPRRKKARMPKAKISKDPGFKKFLEQKMRDFAVKKDEAKRNALKSWCAMRRVHFKPRKSKAAKSAKASLSCG